MENPRTLRGTVYTGIGLTFALLLGVYSIYQMFELVLLLLLTVVLSIVLSGPVNGLARRGVPRAWAVIAILGALAGVLCLLGLALVPMLQKEFRQLARDLPTLLEGVQLLADRSLGLLGLGAPEVENLLAVLGNHLWGAEADSTVGAAAGLGLTLATAISFGLVMLMAAIYLIIQPEPWINGFISLFPAGWRQGARGLLEEMYRTIQKWLLGQIASITIVAVLSTIGLYIIGIPFALLLGIFSGLISFIPYAGPMISVVPPILLALLSDPVKAVWVILAYVAIQQVENHLLQPILMSRAVRLHPALVIFALLVMGKFFGLMGLFLAVPLVAVLQVLVQRLWVARMDQIGTDLNPSSQEESENGKPPKGPLRKALKALGA